MTLEQLVDGSEALHALKRGWLRPDPQYREAPAAPPASGDVVLERGLVRIVPIARAVGIDARQHLGRIREETEREGVWLLGGGDIHAETLLSAREGYGARIAAAGGEWERRACAWRVGSLAVILVHVTAGDTATLALHLVPDEWIWPRAAGLSMAKREISHARTVRRQVNAADPTWEWPTGT